MLALASTAHVAEHVMFNFGFRHGEHHDGRRNYDGKSGDRKFPLVGLQNRPTIPIHDARPLEEGYENLASCGFHKI